MTQEDKELLIKDLCSRLPYDVKVEYRQISCEVLLIDKYNEELTIRMCPGYTPVAKLEDCKPFLFPLSSMTKEQKEFIKNRFCYDWDIDDHPYSLWAYCIEIGDADELIDFFHKNHFDYRCLIEKGVAIDATGLNVY